MSETWATIARAWPWPTAAIRASGPVLLGGRELPGLLVRVIALLAPALLAALIVIGTFTDANGDLELDARAAGLAAAGAVLVRTQGDADRLRGGRGRGGAGAGHRLSNVHRSVQAGTRAEDLQCSAARTTPVNFGHRVPAPRRRGEIASPDALVHACPQWSNAVQTSLPIQARRPAPTRPRPIPDIRLTGISKRYGEVVAIDHVDLEVAAGEFFTMLGPSGSGKTTTLRMIAGSTSPTPAASRSPGRT